MTLKKFSIIGLIIGALALLVGFGTPALTVLLPELSGDIGIVGGADLPTFSFIFWRSGVFVLLATFGIPLVLISIFCLVFPNFVQKNFSVKTTALALGISATGAFGLCCFFTWLGTVMESVKKHPIAYPVSIAGGVLALVLIFALIVIYSIQRVKNFKIVGNLLDVLTSIIFLPFFFLAELEIIEVARYIFHLLE